MFQASANGTVLQSEIVGTVKMRVYLTGMPELRLGLNDKVLFEGSGSEFARYFNYWEENASIVYLSYSGGKSKAVELEDVKFHQCVRLSRWEEEWSCTTTVIEPLSYLRFDNDRTISFIPPDGAFELMSYRLTTLVSFLSCCHVQ